MAEQMVVLKNVGDVPLQVSLHHDLVCAYRQVCTCRTVNHPGRPPERHELAVRLLIKVESDPLPAAVKLIPQVKTGIARGTILCTVAPAKVEKIR